MTKLDIRQDMDDRAIIGERPNPAWRNQKTFCIHECISTTELITYKLTLLFQIIADLSLLALARKLPSWLHSIFHTSSECRSRIVVATNIVVRMANWIARLMWIWSSRNKKSSEGVLSKCAVNRSLRSRSWRRGMAAVTFRWSPLQSLDMALSVFVGFAVCGLSLEAILTNEAWKQRFAVAPSLFIGDEVYE